MNVACEATLHTHAVTRPPRRMPRCSGCGRACTRQDGITAGEGRQFVCQGCWPTLVPVAGRS